MGKTINISYLGDDGQLWYSKEFCDFQLKEKDKEIEELHKLLEEKYYSGNAPKIIDIFHMLDKSTIEKQKEEIERLNNIINELREKNRKLLEDNMRLRKEINLHSGKLYISDVEVKNVF